MTCEEAAVLLHALLDGELDAVHAREVEAHAAGCARCTAQLRDYRAMRQAFAGSDLRFPASNGLRRRLDAALPSPVAHTSRRGLLKGFAAGAAFSGAIAASALVVIWRGDEDGRILGEAISAHLRSLQADHLTDVPSSDQHTVKPWFNGRLDLAPPVVDLTAQGFTLLGGRLDTIDGKAVAAIVYRRRTHVINLFVVQPLGAAILAPRVNSVHGFNVRRWTEQGLDLLAVSDINAEELQEFSEKFQAAIRSGGGI
jgi:anti-sigma factor RsiW